MRFPTLLLAISFVSLTATATHALDAVGEGRRAWLKYNCYGCHGMRAQGGMGRNIQKASRDDVWVSINGSATTGGMRDFKTIMNFTDALNIAAYLKTIGTVNEPKWIDWWRR